MSTTGLHAEEAARIEDEKARNTAAQEAAKASHAADLEGQCSVSAAKLAGLTDGKSRRESRVGAYRLCSDALRPAAVAAYSEGFAQGLQSAQEQTPTAPVPTADAPPPAVTAEAAPNYKCTLKAFTNSYEQQGVSQLQAKNAVLDACKRDHHEMHCSKNDVQCTKL